MSSSKNKGFIIIIIIIVIIILSNILSQDIYMYKNLQTDFLNEQQLANEVNH